MRVYGYIREVYYDNRADEYYLYMSDYVNGRNTVSLSDNYDLETGKKLFQYLVKVYLIP